MSLSNFPGEGGGGPPLDIETEQLISEIELLTSRALQETNQWSERRSTTTTTTTTTDNVVEENSNNEQRQQQQQQQQQQPEMMMVNNNNWSVAN